MAESMAGTVAGADAGPVTLPGPSGVEDRVQGIRVAAHGGPEVLEYAELPDPRPGRGQVLVRLAAAGVNFIDVYLRTGLYPGEPPFVPGQEGAGTVVEVGPDVDGFAPGDRVAWSDAPGSYAELVLAPASRLVAVPEAVPLDTAAAMMLQGMTAHYLCRDTFPLGAGQRCLVHAGAGGVGLLLIQLAKRAGAEVFTTVGSPEKADLARAAGADHVLRYDQDDFGDAVEAIAGPKPLDVVFDGVGRQTFDRGLTLLRPRGMMVTFGNASGPVEPLSPLRLMQLGSLYLTRPTLGHYIAGTEELRRRAGELFDLVAVGDLAVRIGSRYPLAEAGRAHRALEERATTGKVLLDPL